MKLSHGVVMSQERREIPGYKWKEGIGVDVMWCSTPRALKTIFLMNWRLNQCNNLPPSAYHMMGYEPNGSNLQPRAFVN